MGQMTPINKILNKIYDNYMYFESDLASEYIYKYKSNIMVIGELGCGKSTIKDSLIRNFAPIPVISFKLTGDVGEDISEIARRLWILSDGNKFLAERGMVIFDTIESIGDYDNHGDLNTYVQELEEIIKTRDVYLKNKNGEIFKFDYSFITNILMLDMDYDFSSEVKYDDLYYSKIYGSKLMEMGFTPSMINNLFDNEIIFMNEMTKELATSILKNKEISPLYQLKNVLEERGKKVRISKNFVSNLVDYGLDYKEGFHGIIKTLKYLQNKKDMSLKEIKFIEDEVFDLKIGTANLFHDELYNEFMETNPETKTETKSKTGLDVDIKNRTINNLKIRDVVNIIKKRVLGQDEAIFSIVNSFYNHIFNQNRGYTKEDLNELKENVLIFGSTGVGKTAIVKALASIFDITYVREIATRYSKTGFVGQDVDSILYDLVDAAHGDIEKAEHGILYIDEIDKIKSGGGGNVESMAEGVQDNLLTLIEGDVRTMEPSAGRAPLTFDTSNLWVIGTGAFDGLDDCIKQRIKRERGLGKVGFGDKDTNLKVLPEPTDDDLHEYGFDRQFLRRFPNKVPLQNLNVDVFYDIINNPNGGFVNLIKKGLESDGIVVSISEEFKKELAKKAMEKKQGAAGIKSTFIKYKQEIDKNIQDGDVEKVILDKTCIDNLKNITYVKRKK